MVWTCALVISLVTVAFPYYFSGGRVWAIAMSTCTSIIIITPLSIITISYGLIWVKVSFRRNIPNHAYHQINRKLTLAIVTLVSLITWLPFMLFSLLFGICVYLNCSTMFTSKSLIDFFKIIYFANSFVNFIVYVVHMPEFRMEIVRTMRRGCCEKNSLQVSNLSTRKGQDCNHKTIETKF